MPQKLTEQVELAVEEWLDDPQMDSEDCAMADSAMKSEGFRGSCTRWTGAILQAGTDSDLIFNVVMAVGISFLRVGMKIERARHEGAELERLVGDGR